MSRTWGRLRIEARGFHKLSWRDKFEGFFDVVGRETDRSVPEPVEAVMLDVTEWTGGQGLQDDMSMLVARRR